jgi:hypothetical protein
MHCIFISATDEVSQRRRIAINQVIDFAIYRT